MGTDATSQPAAERSAASSAIDSAAPKEPRTAAELPPASVNDTGLIANGKVPANLPADPALNVTPTMVPQPTSSSAAGPGALDYFVQPVYPPIARAAAVQGQVVLSALIGKDGRVIKVRVVDGSALLAQAALDAVKQWRYRPSYMNGEPIEIERKVTVDFSLPR
jgi:protein TonB